MLRELLKADYGIDLPISGGDGNSKSEPIVIEADTARVASRIQMEVARCIYASLGYHWRAVGKEILGTPTGTLEKLICEVKFPEGDLIVTERRAFYFDIDKVEVEPGKGTPPCRISLGDAYPIDLPFQIGWFHFTGLTDNEQQSPGMGISIAYSAPYTKATIYLYNNQLPEIHYRETMDLFVSEFDSAVDDFLTMNPKATQLAESRKDNMIFKSFSVGSAYAIVMLSTINNLFFKVRVTKDGSKDSYVFKCLMESLSYMAAILDSTALRSSPH